MKKLVSLILWCVLWLGTSVFIVNVLLALLLKRKNSIPNFRDASTTEEEFLQFIERNVDSAPIDMDEGIGTVYERRVINKYFKTIKDRFCPYRILEYPADGVTGFPGINSLWFARNGCEVWIGNPSAKMLNKAKQAWDKIDANLAGLVADVSSFSDDNFDLVWNYCIFERLNSEELVSEMSRLSNYLVLVMTQNKHNVGTKVHKLYHNLYHLKWDHGDEDLMTVEKVVSVAESCGLNIIETGSIDIPPIMDTWDMPLRGALKSILSKVGKEWEWKDSSSQDSFFLRLFEWMEDSLPNWFKMSQAHHYYVLCRKSEK